MSHNLERTALEAIEQYHMLPQGGRVLAGVSGGADSVALLHFLWSCRKEYGWEVGALHLNHHLRGEESLRDETFVRALCAGWGIPLTVEGVGVGALAKETKSSLEECARRERYAFFARHCPPGARIATAHTMTDSAETMLINLVRGTGLRGLCGIPPVRENIVRPLINCSRREVEAYCAAHGLGYVTDSSNLEEDYSRNKLRHRVLPVLRELNPAVERSMKSAAELLRQDADYLEELASREEAALSREGGWDPSGLMALPFALRRRVLIRLLAQRDISYDRERLERLEGIAAKGGVVQLDARWSARCAESESGKNILCLERLDKGLPVQDYFEAMVDATALHKGNMTEIPLCFGKTVYLLRTDYENFEESNKDSKKALKNALDYDRISGILKLRQRLPGDSLRPVGRGCSKSLKNLFQECGVPVVQRLRTVVLSADSHPAWVEGFGPDERYAVRPGETREVLVVSVTETL